MDLENKLHKIAVSSFIVKNGKLLILKRDESEEFLPGYWEVPGGSVEVGENIAEAVVREAKEEAGIDVIAGRLFAHFEFLDRHNQSKVNMNFLCTQNNTAQEVNPEAGEMNKAAWVEMDELEKYKMTPNMMDACKKALEEVKHHGV